MKIMQIYSNNDEFKWVRFNEGYNVILGEIVSKNYKDSDQHNLGKSTLIEVIDFMLLKEVRKDHFLKKHNDKFNNFVFFIELKIENDKFITIKRSVEEPTKVSLKMHSHPYQDFRNSLNWDYVDLMVRTKNSAKSAKVILDREMNHYISDKYSFRKYVGYFLRTQYDYDEVFKLSKYEGNQIDWKPLLLELMGFDGGLLHEKLSLDSQIKNTQEYLKKMKQELSVSENEIDIINSFIEAKMIEKSKIQTDLDEFDFYFNERQLNKDLVDEIEHDISELNALEYNLKYEISKLLDSLSKKTEFDLISVEKIFNEVSVFFTDQLKRSYEQLIQFNSEITQERNEYYEKVLNKKNEELRNIHIALKKKNDERSKLLKVLKEEDSFKKYKTYQNQLIEIESEISSLLAKLDNVDIIKAVQKQLRRMQDELVVSKEKLRNGLEEPNQTYVQVKAHFMELVKSILGVAAVIYFSFNKDGNPDFMADFISIDKAEHTKINAQSKGYSYRKLLCVCFDLALLITHSKQSFVKFAYHDGTFESLSDSRKLKYIEVVKTICEKYDIQYILTTLSDDIPRTETGEKYKFADDEVALTLHDKEDDSGRLFSFQF